MDSGVAHAILTILAILSEREEITQTEICKIGGLNERTAKKAILYLAKNGIITRTNEIRRNMIAHPIKLKDDWRENAKMTADLARLLGLVKVVSKMNRD